MGDVPSPPDFAIDGCEFYSLARQAATGFKTAQLLPTRHYTRKNIGYLLAIQSGARIILETDDDNFPRPGFWEAKPRLLRVPLLERTGWANVYAYFTDANIWPRGLALDAIRRPLPEFESLPELELDCPIQQGLADENPDVDAIYRLALPLPVNFRSDRRVALGPGCWCPFNSQNTTWYADAFPLLYLPSCCSFRMTDIWRSFVAQRIAWENGWRLLFREADVYQERNEHNLMRDFQDEIPGYLHNGKIVETLARLDLAPGVESIGPNLLSCYEALVDLGIVDRKELLLVEAWLADLRELARSGLAPGDVTESGENHRR
jgi:hypothetical protein